jgi:hypothetical protein
VRRTIVIRAAVGLIFALLFFGALVAIWITGPIVARIPRLAGELSIAPSPERLRRDVELLAGLAPRDGSQPENLTRAAEWIGDELRAAGLEVALEPYGSGPATVHNVVGLRRGLDPRTPVRVLGARYDSRGPHAGADDNASGVAVLLEIARTLQPETPLRSQYFVAFGTQDAGSRRFVEGLVERGVPVDVMVSLDTVGYYDDRPGSQRFPRAVLRWLYPSEGSFVAIVGDTGAGPTIRQLKLSLGGSCDVPLLSLRAPRSLAPGFESDHRAFRERGLPGVLITDTGALRNPNLLHASDTPDTLDYERMARLVRCFHGLLWDRDIGG